MNEKKTGIIQEVIGRHVLAIQYCQDLHLAFNPIASAELLQDELIQAVRQESRNYPEYTARAIRKAFIGIAE